MLVLRYFGWVGGALLVLLLLADSQLQRAEPRKEPELNVNIRIKSAAPAPEAVTFAGHAATYATPPAMEIVDFAARADAAGAQESKAAEARQAYAKATAEAQPAAKPAPQRPRRQHAKRRVSPPPDPYEMRIVQARDWWSWPRFE